MKAASLSLKIVAILAAAFCVYAWMDTRGKISSAEGHLKDIAGESLEARAAKVPSILKEKAQMAEKIKAFEGRVRTLEQRNNSMNSELESERAKNVQANSDLVKKNAEIRSLNSSLSTTKKQVAEKDTLIETLKREIVASKTLVTQNNESDGLKEKVATLESQLKAKEGELAAANEKLKILDMSEIVEVIETDDKGNKIKRKILKTPYIATGDIATVLKVDQKNAMVSINRGTKNGVKQDQKIILKREGRVVSEILMTEVKEDISVGLINRNLGIPETIETGDLLEMASPVVKKAVPAPAPAAPAENKPAAETTEA